jgi:hypothetical protein
MGRDPAITKISDDETCFRCAGGIGILREEVWVDNKGEVIKYNLAFVLAHLTRVDNGRVLGYDNAHGVHERHCSGKVEVFTYNGFTALTGQFYREVEALRRGYED